MCRRTAGLVAAFGCLLSADCCSTTHAAAGAQIVFLAGPKDHGRPGRHEYERDLRVLASGLENSPDLAGAGVTTRVFVGSAPRDLNEFRDAAAIVIESSSDRWERETHPLFPADPLTNHRGYDDESTAWLKSLDELIKQQRIGVVIFHYATWVENWTARGYYVSWTGGLWVQMISRNPVDQWSMTLESAEHPILRGVQPWTYRDEIFCRFLLPNDSRRTNLLLATPTEDKLKIGPQIAAWAYERDDGGRSFVFGGVDFHDNMAVEDYRKFLLNGIAWAARLDVPEGGVSSSLPSEFQASANAKPE
jgi:type 1 glutamine amidotransferase